MSGCDFHLNPELIRSDKAVLADSKLSKYMLVALLTLIEWLVIIVDWLVDGLIQEHDNLLSLLWKKKANFPS